MLSLGLARWAAQRFRSTRSAGLWRGESAFRGRPWWVRMSVAVIVLIDGALSGWNIGRSSYNSYYADSARSMSLNWHALFFGAFDPGATITLDKLSGFLVPQVLSTWLFGFHPWSTMLPQVVEGMLTVLAAYVVAGRWKGPAAGLTAAAALATTPLLISMFGRSSEDAMITMSLSLAFWCWQSAVLSGRLVPLLGSCAWIAVGFQAKMAQAWFIVPALALGYLLAAPHPVGRRVRRAAVAGVVTVVLSLSWITAMALTPASERPYIDGTSNNNPFTMVFGYNGFNRVFPGTVPGVIGNPVTPSSRPGRSDLPVLIIPATEPGPTPVAPSVSRPAGPGYDKLFLPLYSTQVGWLYPLALAGGMVGSWPLLRRRRRIRPGPSGPDPVGAGSDPGQAQDTDMPAGRGQAGVDQAAIKDLPPAAPGSAGVAAADRRSRASAGTAAALLGWLMIDAVFLSTSAIPHISYLSAVAVQIAVLAGGGAVQAGRLRRGSSALLRAVPALLMVTQTAWILRILTSSGVAPLWVAPVVAVCGLCAGLALLPGVPLTRRAGWAVTAIAVGAVLLAPIVWSVFTITAGASYADAYGGPAVLGRHRGIPALSPRGQPFDVLTPLQRSADPMLSPAQQSLVDYLRPRTGPGPLMAVDTWRVAEPYILDQGLDVRPMGGFTGVAPTPTVPQLQHQVDAGVLRFVLLHSLIPRRGFGGAYLTGFAGVPGMYDGPKVVTIRVWITTHCAAVPAISWEGAHLHVTAETLYQCGPDTAAGQHW